MTSRDMYTCGSCGYKDKQVECAGMFHCPNALCTGAGGAWFRATLKSYKDIDGNMYGCGRHTVDELEYLIKGVIHNLKRGIFIMRKKRKKSNVSK